MTLCALDPKLLNLKIVALKRLGRSSTDLQCTIQPVRPTWTVLRSMGHKCWMRSICWTDTVTVTEATDSIDSAMNLQL